ncbi:prepilin peptidase [Asanoa siamensis]|uniref:Leader peptidase (Prepilin peptidase)/N-methyltransferase n=1 Tax=Asanoa siamensis TaxID=926357 RepID=A0ABQ4CS71_9ACTN|nr:prepilin peptidase [Asanoa siamensis]GIF74141.1 hypothetical protein Asi02nite_36590 [Asanoa siamensis]
MADLASIAALAAAVSGFVAALPVAATAHGAPRTGTVPVRWRHTGTPKAATVGCALTTAGVAFAVCHAIGWNIVTPGYWLFSVLGVGLSYVDLRLRRLPHLATGVLWSTCAALFLIESIRLGVTTHLIQAVTCGTLVSMSMLLAALALPGQLGLGDVHLAGAVAFTLGWLDWKIALTAITGAWIAQGIWGWMSVLRTRRRGIALPFGPTLFVAWAIAASFR